MSIYLECVLECARRGDEVRSLMSIGHEYSAIHGEWPWEAGGLVANSSKDVHCKDETRCAERAKRRKP